MCLILGIFLMDRSALYLISVLKIPWKYHLLIVSIIINLSNFEPVFVYKCAKHAAILKTIPISQNMPSN